MGCSQASEDYRNVLKMGRQGQYRGKQGVWACSEPCWGGGAEENRQLGGPGGVVRRKEELKKTDSWEVLGVRKGPRNPTVHH